jgi:NMD protein affecting ribosome stability and mRNA decay
MKTLRSRNAAGRKEQRTPARHDDSYLADAKQAGPIACARCGATYRRGRWTWKPADDDLPRDTCPACKRIQDNFPAGHLLLRGDFFAAHRAEIMQLVAAREARARLEHPMQRIIAAQDVARGVLVTTTDAHLARTLGIAVRDAFKGDLDIDFGHDENFLRASWKR